MTSLTDVHKQFQEGLAAATHLLILGDTKTGKSDYVAQAAIDGFQVIYLDRDNGLTTLLDQLKDSPEALKRIHYFNPVDMPAFLEALLTMPIARYNVRTRTVPAFSDWPDDRIIEIKPAKIPKGTILSLDSWSSFCMNLIEQQAERKKVSLLDVDMYSREIYGGTGFRATQFADMLRVLPFHTIVQGHGVWYERKEKPPGRAGAVEEKDMLIRETKQVPMSTSNPHGATMGKFFNQIGWLEINRFDKRVLDFRAINGRVGSGTPNAIGDPRKEFRFSNLFAKVPVYPDDSTWLTEMSSKEMKQKAQGASTVKFTGSRSTVPKPASPAAPTNFLQKSKLQLPKPAESTTSEPE